MNSSEIFSTFLPICLSFLTVIMNFKLLYNLFIDSPAHNHPKGRTPRGAPLTPRKYLRAENIIFFAIF
ncbi:Protein CBG27343 [Caenorhabditis briggsae]|uniref:Protein CBG27343 n=1 Tax=Caenorhabditis briggsae TaxID=6238 RepID=B6IGE4_CAEBR|nr:Protein CBG27343 [Caenorhabditis briggsae]CAR98974.1 Protein CBG27343 [Caenorhabditis briggsae]